MFNAIDKMKVAVKNVVEEMEMAIIAMIMVVESKRAMVAKSKLKVTTRKLMVVAREIHHLPHRPHAHRHL